VIVLSKKFLKKEMSLMMKTMMILIRRGNGDLEIKKQAIRKIKLRLIVEYEKIK